MIHGTAGLAWLLLLWSCLPAACLAARSANKSESLLTFVVVGEPMVDVDRIFFASRMVAAEVNARTDVFPDATLQIVRETNIHFFDDDTAKVSDYATRMCDAPGNIGASMDLTSGVVIRALLVCKTLPTYSIGSAIDDLSNKEKYPLFWRYTSTWGQTVLASVSIYHHFGWTKTAVVYISYGTFARVGKLIVDVLPRHDIEVVAKVALEPYQAPGRYYDQVRTSFEFLKSTKLRIFTIIGMDSDIPLIMMAANATGLVGPDYVWITPQTFAVISTETSDQWGGPVDPSILRGVTFLSNGVESAPPNDYTRAWRLRFEAARQNMIANDSALYPTVDVTDTNPMSEKNPLFFMYDDPGEYEQPSYAIQFGYDALWSLVTAWDHVINSHGTTAQALVNGTLRNAITLRDVLQEAMRSTDILGAVNLTYKGDLSADPVYMRQYDADNNFVIVGILRVNDNTGLSNLTLYPNFNWTGARSLDDVPIDFPAPVVVAVSLQFIATKLFLACYAIATLVCIASGWYVWHYRAAQGIFHRMPTLLCISSAGMVIALANTFTLVGGDLPMRCRFRPWPLALGLTLILSSMIAKSYRMHVVFRCMRADAGFERHTVSLARLLRMIRIVVLVMLILLSIQTTFFPYYTELVYIEANDTYNSVCVASGLPAQMISGVIMTIIGVMIIAAAAFAYINRILPKEFNDVRQITISAYIIIVLAVVGLSQGYLSAQSPKTQFYIESTDVILGIMALNATLLGEPIRDSIRRRRANLSQKTRKKASERTTLAGRSTLHSAQPQMWEHLDAESETILRIVGHAVTQARPSHVTRGNIYRSDKVLAMSASAQVQKQVTLTLVCEPLFLLGVMENLTEEPRYVPLQAVRRVKLAVADQPWLERSLELQVRGKLVMLTFETVEERGCWADAITNGLIRQRGATHLEASGQIVDVQETIVEDAGS